MLLEGHITCPNGQYFGRSSACSCGVRESRTRTYDHVAQVLHWTSYRRWHEGSEERTKITRITLRYTFPQELAALLHYNGFTVVRRYGDWDGEPLTAASPRIIVVCRKRT